MNPQISPRHYIGFKACPSRPLLCSSTSFLSPCPSLGIYFLERLPQSFLHSLCPWVLPSVWPSVSWELNSKTWIDLNLSDSSEESLHSSSGVTASLSLSVFTSLSPAALAFRLWWNTWPRTSELCHPGISKCYSHPHSVRPTAQPWWFSVPHLCPVKP